MTNALQNEPSVELMKGYLIGICMMIPLLLIMFALLVEE